MKTAELIRRLQEADPSGEAECVVGTDDIYFVELLPCYYDGSPLLLVHDEKLRDNSYSVVGARYMRSGNKVRITTMDLEAVLWTRSHEALAPLSPWSAQKVKASRAKEAKWLAQSVSNDVERCTTADVRFVSVSRLEIDTFSTSSNGAELTSDFTSGNGVNYHRAHEGSEIARGVSRWPCLRA
jgi:hypothetical protein